MDSELVEALHTEPAEVLGAEYPAEVFGAEYNEAVTSYDNAK